MEMDRFIPGIYREACVTPCIVLARAHQFAASEVAWEVETSPLKAGLSWFITVSHPTGFLSVIGICALC